MKIYILVDMEGISGLRKMQQVKKDFPSDYKVGCQLMMADINNIIAALFDNGATEVVVTDNHAGGGQVDVTQMDSRAVYETQGLNQMMPSLDESFDGVILLGVHSKAGTLHGFLDHTMSSASWFSFKLNDVEMGEIGIQSSFAGHYNVPVILATGDEAAIKEAKQTLGTVEGAIVKWGIGRNRAKCLSIPEAHKKIREAVPKGLALIGEAKPFKPQLPVTMELTFYRSDMADGYENKPDVKRIDARTIRKQIDSLRYIKSW